MIIRMVKAEIKYLYYEFCSISRANIVFALMFIGVYFYGLVNSDKLNTYTNGDCYLIIQLLSFYLLLRMILTGFSLPVNIFEAEKNRCGYLLNNTVSSNSVITSLTIRIVIKAVNNTLINFFIILILFSAWNFVVDIRNYILIILLMLIGTFYMLSLGFVANLIIQFFGINRELIFIFEIVMFVAYNLFYSDNYLFPITILMTQLSGVFVNDILYSTFKLEEVLGYWELWLIMILMYILIIIVSTYLMNIIQTLHIHKSKRGAK